MALEHSDISVCELSASLCEHCAHLTWTQGTECFVGAAHTFFLPLLLFLRLCLYFPFSRLYVMKFKSWVLTLSNYWCEVNVFRNPPSPPELFNPIIFFFYLNMTGKGHASPPYSGLTITYFSSGKSFQKCTWKIFSTWNNGTHIFHSIFLHTAKIT